MTDRLPDAGELSAMLARRVDQICAQLLPAGKRGGGYWQVGGVDNSKGQSMWVHLAGDKAGKWQDAATGEFGDALDLVAACLYHGDKKAAYQWGLDYMGITHTGRTPPAPARPPTPAASRPDPSDDEKRKKALAMWLKGEADIGGTPVEDYLKGRGINLRELGRFPGSLRFHPSLYHAPTRAKWPAMVAAISGPDGTHLATHRTWLERAGGGGWIKLRADKPKMVYGAFAGGSIRLWRGASDRPLKEAPPDDKVMIVEGIETGLTVAMCCPEFRVLAGISLGNVGSVWLPDQLQAVTLHPENDDNPAAQAAFLQVMKRHQDRGRIVFLARAPVGKDLNDTLQGWGKAA